MLTATLTACGGGGGGGGAEPAPDPGVAGSPYFPLSVGSRWRMDEQGSPVVTVVSGTQVIDGSVAAVLTSIDSSGSSDEYVVKSDSGIRQIPGPQSDVFTRQVGPFDTVRFPLRTGSSYVAVEKALPPTDDVDGDGRLDPLTVRLDVTVVGFERVVLHVGNFENCLHLRSVFVYTYTFSSNGQRGSVTVTADEWFAADIGRVKSTTRTVAGTRVESSDSSLVTYKVGGNRGNAGQPAPTVTSIAPSGPAAVGPNTALVLNFSDDMDPASVGNSSLRVVGPGGAAVAGTVSWTNARTLKFTPTASWANGSHSVALLPGATDLFGVALAPVPAATFLVDAIAPTAETLTPLANSLGVSAQITVRFSEPMDRSTQPPVLTVTGPTGIPLSGAVMWQDERTLAVVANGAIASGTYTGNLAPGALDLAGNAMRAGVQWQFTIDASGPTLVNTLPASGAEDVPVNSELRVTFDEPIAPGSVSASTAGLYKNNVLVPTALRAEGSSVVLTPASPLLRGVAYVVRLGNGVTDRLGNGLSQAVEVPFVTDSGRFALPRQLPALDSRYVARLKLADLDGDRAADLLVVQRTDSLNGQMTLVPRLPDGTLASTGVVIPTPAGGLPEQLAVADFSGDGITDFAAGGFFGPPSMYVQGSNGRFVRESLWTFETGTGLTPIALSGSSRPGLVDYVFSGSLRLWRPAAGGGMQDPELLAIAGAARPSQLAVADVNGDGRQDIVALSLDNFNRFLQIWTQRSDGGFDFQTVATPRATGAPFALADLDNDGRQEVVVGDGATGLRIMRQTSAGTWEAGDRISLPYMPTQVQAVDFDGDGRMDLVVQHGISESNDAVRFSVVLNKTAGTYQVINPFDFDELPALPNAAFLVADFTGDGRLDFLVGQQLLRQKPVASASTVQPGLQKPAAVPKKRSRMPPLLLLQKSM